ncbi:MAG: hypothetical protein KF681_08550 [Bdellovibrionaceae bacterium]|nr:hypothetical protein [Pseudobdellovibrionaceae bacterium]
MKRNYPLTLVCLFSLLSGCSVAGIRRHQPSVQNIRTAESLKNQYSVSGVESDNPRASQRLNKRSMGCRMVNYELPTPLFTFVKDALTDELDAARKLSPSGAPISISVIEIDSDTSGMNDGYWNTHLIYDVNGKKYDIKKTTRFESAYMADVACRNTGNALTDALAENFAGFYRELAGAEQAQPTKGTKK